MSCGEYKGIEICNLPDDYLKWVAENWEDDDIREEAEEIMISREDQNVNFK